MAILPGLFVYEEQHIGICQVSILCHCYPQQIHLSDRSLPIARDWLLHSQPRRLYRRAISAIGYAEYVTAIRITGIYRLCRLFSTVPVQSASYS